MTKRQCRNALSKAIEDTRAIPAPTCSACDRPCKTVGHHPDYRRPLYIVWLCGKCHGREHANRTNRGIAIDYSNSLPVKEMIPIGIKLPSSVHRKLKAQAALSYTPLLKFVLEILEKASNTNGKRRDTHKPNVG